MMRRVGPALAAASLAMQAPPLAATDFVCRGHDPGWEFQGADGRAVYKPGRGAARNLAGSAADLAAEGVVVWRGRAGDGAGGGDLVAVMLKGACTDPAAGDLATHSAIVSLPGSVVVVGCCSLGTGQGAVVAALSPDVLPPAPPLSPAPATPAPGLAPAKEQPAPSAESTPAEKTVAAVPPPTPPPARATAGKVAAKSLAAGTSARVAGPSRERVYLRLDASERARVAGSLPGGHPVVVGEAAQRGGRTWYRVEGKGVPDRAWIRGDLLVGGEG